MDYTWTEKRINCPEFYADGFVVPKLCLVKSEVCLV